MRKWDWLWNWRGTLKFKALQTDLSTWTKDDF
jgi:hypothetical protein